MKRGARGGDALGGWFAGARDEYAARIIRRRTAARRYRARPGASAQAAAGGRADRQPRSGERCPGALAVARTGQDQACGVHPGHAFAGGGGDRGPDCDSHRAGIAGGRVMPAPAVLTLSPAALFLAPLAQHKGRLAVSVLAIALGVALGYAVQLINAVAVNEFSQAVQSLAGEADLEIRGPRSGFDEMLYPRIARLPQVAVASPVLEVDAKLAGRQETLRLLGMDAFRAAYVQPGLIGNAPADMLELLRPDALFLSPAAADWLGLKIGDRLAVQVGLAEVSLRVAGLLHLSLIHISEPTRLG